VRTDIPRPNPARLVDFSLRASAETVPFSDLQLVSALLNIPPSHSTTAVAASDFRIRRRPFNHLVTLRG
jgi:hypothetical protein